MDTFNKALSIVLNFEGGYTNDPADPGGATNKGIIQSEYNDWRKAHHLSVQSVKLISDTEVNTIYQTSYWVPSHASDFQEALAIVMFDTAVNFGVKHAVQFLQKALSINTDGQYGSATKAAALKSNQKTIALAICDERMAFRHERVIQNPSQQVFLKGWLNRDSGLKTIIQKLS